LRIEEPVRRFMSSPVHAVRRSASLDEVQELLAACDISSVAVVEKDTRIVGVISRTDLLRVGRVHALDARGRPLLRLPETRVERRMRTDLVTVAPDTTVARASALMVERHIHRVYVCDGERLVGVFSTRDAMRALVEQRPRAMTPIVRLLSRPVMTVAPNDTVAAATDRLTLAGVRGLAVVEGEWPVGLFTQAEALAARDRPAETEVEEVMSYGLLCLPSNTPLHRAAAHALATRARRVLAVEGRRLVGILTGVDIAAAMM